MLTTSLPARPFMFRAELRRFVPLAGSAQLSRFAITQPRDELPLFYEMVGLEQKTFLNGKKCPGWTPLLSLQWVTDISSEHSLRTCTQVRRNVRKSDVVYAYKQKKNATEVTVSGIWLYGAELSSRGGHPCQCSCVLTVVLAKGIVSQLCRCFCKRNALLRVGKAHDRFE